MIRHHSSVCRCGIADFIVLNAIKQYLAVVQIIMPLHARTKVVHSFPSPDLDFHLFLLA